MSNITITISASSFNNGAILHKTLGLYNDLPPIKLLKKFDQPQLSFNFSSKHEISRVVPMLSRSLRLRASSSSSSPSSPPPSPPSSQWKKWVMGILLTVVLPAAGHKGGLLIVLKGKIDAALETVDHVAEMVEEMAEKAEEIVDQVEEKLPGDSKMREALESFENLAKMAAKEAKKADNLIHKIKDVEEEIEEGFMKAGKDQEQEKEQEQNQDKDQDKNKK